MNLKNLFYSLGLSVLMISSAGADDSTTAGGTGPAQPTYLTCLLYDQTTVGGQCPGPNPTNPGYCAFYIWNGPVCSLTNDPTQTCSGTLTWVTVSMYQGSCVNGPDGIPRCTYSGPPTSWSLVINECPIGTVTTAGGGSQPPTTAGLATTGS